MDAEVMWRMVVMAVVQGVTEFIPVSSSGHLVLTKNFLGLDAGDGALTEIVLHAGSLVSILVYYRRRLWELLSGAWTGFGGARRELAIIALGCMPVILVYMVVGRRIEALFALPGVAAVSLTITGLVLLSVFWARDSDAPVDARRGLLVGFAQAAALVPGISRSGATIVAARHLGVSGKRAAEYSFLMAAPLLFGACLIGARDLMRGADTGQVTGVALTVGFMVSAIVGLAAIDMLVRSLRRRLFAWFGLYALTVGLGSLAWMAFRS